MSEIITCPSGLIGRIRGVLAREERILADRKPAKAGGRVSHDFSDLAATGHQTGVSFARTPSVPCPLTTFDLPM